MRTLSLTSNELLLKLDPFLREQLSERYDATFEFGGFGDRLLQAARIVLFKALRDTREGIHDLFDSVKKKDHFFRMLDSEIKEPGDRSLHFLPSLDRERGEGRSKLMYIVEARETNDGCSIVTPGDEEFDKVALSSIPHSDSLICRLIGVETIEKIVQGISHNDASQRIRQGVSKVKSIIESAVSGKYAALRRVYEEGVHKVYDGIVSGEIKNWQVFSSRGGGFFSWAPNVKEVIRYATTSYLLPYYDCKIEDLPIQAGLKRVTAMHRFLHIGDNRKLSLRSFFLVGFPEFEDGPHWHPARWGTKGLSEKVKNEYRNYIVDYVFRHRLGCGTRGDVINHLNNPDLLKGALDKEKIEAPSQKVENGSFYRLIDRLEGDMYAIDPWELRHRVRDGTWVNSDGSPNLDNVRKYLEWVDRNYGMPRAHEISSGKIPHFYGMYSSTGLPISELRKLIGVKN